MIKALLDDTEDSKVMELICVDIECAYKTPKLEYADAATLLKLHTEVIHPAGPPL